MQKIEKSLKNQVWFGKWDSINSTFQSKIYCKTGKILPGYSKGINSKEDSDKIVCIQKWIKRLLNSKKGYFNPDNVVCIEIYLKGFLEKDNELIFTLYPTTYKMGFNEKFSLNPRLISFLNGFYKEIKEGTYNIEKLISKPIRSNEELLFDASITRFKNEDELLEFVYTKKKEGHAPGLLLNYASKYRENHF
jgi:hypothetical protein